MKTSLIELSLTLLRCILSQRGGTHFHPVGACGLRSSPSMTTVCHGYGVEHWRNTMEEGEELNMLYPVGACGSRSSLRGACSSAWTLKEALAVPRVDRASVAQWCKEKRSSSGYRQSAADQYEEY